MRAEAMQIGGLTVLNDCYNANPASMKNALAMLHNLRPADGANPSRRLVFICGEMAELGSQTQALHAELGRAVAEAGVDLLVTVGQPAPNHGPSRPGDGPPRSANEKLRRYSFRLQPYAGIPPQRRYTIGQGLSDGPVGAGGGGVG